MVDQNDTKPSNPDQTASAPHRGSRRGTFLIALLAVALLAGIGGSMLSTAFGQGAGWHRISWRDHGVFGDSLTPAQIDDRIDRMTKHMAIELDATQDQQVKLATIAKAAVADLRPLKEKAQGARAHDRTHHRSYCNRAPARRAARACGDREQTYRAGLGRRRRCAQPRAAPESRGLDGAPSSVDALASWLMGPRIDGSSWANVSS
jgi:hypothetical protein